MPAAILDVQIIDIEDDDGRIDIIWEAFQNPPLIRSIDLRGIQGQNETATENEDNKFDGDTGTAKDEQASDNPDGTLEEDSKVRFQYDGFLNMNVIFDQNNATTLDCFDPDVYDDADSFHVIEYMTIFRVRIDVFYQIAEDKLCDVVDQDKHDIVVSNDVGLEDQKSPGFEKFYSDLDGLTKELLALCSETTPPGGEAPGPCIYGIQHDSGGRKAGIDVSYATGRPNILDTYTKNIFFSVSSESEEVKHKAVVFVDGLYSKGPGNSFALPTHAPIMVLRDPPGGNSYASFENIVTTVKVESATTRVSGSGNMELMLRTGLEFLVTSCFGGGFGAIALVCKVRILFIF